MKNTVTIRNYLFYSFIVLSLAVACGTSEDEDFETSAQPVATAPTPTSTQPIAGSTTLLTSPTGTTSTTTAGTGGIPITGTTTSIGPAMAPTIITAPCQPQMNVLNPTATGAQRIVFVAGTEYPGCSGVIPKALDGRNEIPSLDVCVELNGNQIQLKDISTSTLSSQPAAALVGYAGLLEVRYTFVADIPSGYNYLRLVNIPYQGTTQCPLRYRYEIQSNSGSVGTVLLQSKGLPYAVDFEVPGISTTFPFNF